MISFSLTLFRLNGTDSTSITRFETNAKDQTDRRVQKILKEACKSEGISYLRIIQSDGLFDDYTWGLTVERYRHKGKRLAMHYEDLSDTEGHYFLRAIQDTERDSELRLKVVHI